MNEEAKERFVGYGGLLVLFVSFGIYLHTLTPTVGLHDSGEMIACVYTLGIAHPPGYPLYTIFGKLWTTLIPIGNIAYRMNMQSALFASLAVMMIYFITLKLSTRAPEHQNNSSHKIEHQSTRHQSTRMIPSIVASLILAFSPTFWEQAVIAEKYTLNAFFFSLLIFILLKWQETQNSKLKTQNYLFWFAFILGLSFTHHFQTIYVVPASLFLIVAALLNREALKTQRKKLKTQNSKLKTKFAFCIFLFLLPLLLWFYLPIRASMHPPLNWGCSDTWERFVEHISAKDYQVGYLQPLVSSLKARFIPHLNLFAQQFGFYLIPLGLLGLIFLFAKKLMFGVYLLLMILTNLFFAIRYNIINIEDYYIPSLLLFSLLIGYFLHYTLYTIHYTLSKFSFPFLLIPKTALCILFLILPIYQCRAHYSTSDHSNHYIAYDHARNVLKYTKKRAVIFLDGDENLFPCWYAHYIERQRSNSVIIQSLILWKQQELPDQPYANQIKEKYPDIDLTGDVYKEKIRERIGIVKATELIENNPSKRPIYTLFYDENLSNKYILIPKGVLWKVTKNNDLIKEMDKERPKFDLRGAFVPLKRKDEEWLRLLIISKYFNLFNNRGTLYYQHKIYDKAIVEFEDALKIDPKNAKTIELYKILGFLYFQKGMKDKVIEANKMVLKLEPNNIQAKQNIKVLQREGLKLR